MMWNIQMYIDYFLLCIRALWRGLNNILRLHIKKVNCLEWEQIRVPSRYKFENNKVMDDASPDVSSSLHYQPNGNGKIGFDISSKGTHNQLLERQCQGSRGIKSSQLWKWKESLMMLVAQRCMDALTNEDAILLCPG